MASSSSSATPSIKSSTASSAVVGPTSTAIATAMFNTVEVATGEHFAARGAVPVSVPGGSGGYLTAAWGGRTPSADGHGQLVFFWHDETFVGWDARYEATQILKIWAAGTNQIAVKYADYAQTDAACCPSLPPITLYYSWEHGRLAADGAPPYSPGHPVYVTYR